VLQSTSPKTKGGTKARIRVMLADDHTLMRSGLRMVLGRADDIEIVGEAATGEEAVALARECAPAVIVMDLEMPGAGGLAATRAITSAEGHPRVLVLTMYPEDEHLTAALRAGASGYLTKDLAEQELAEALRVVAGGDVYVRPHVAPLLAASLGRHPPEQPDLLAGREQFDRLSNREKIVLRMVAEGHSGPEIGRALGIAAKTVDTYRQRIQQKIGLANRTAYIRFALSIDLLKK
jgi:two-component system, NarL family, response regulator NreC